MITIYNLLDIQVSDFVKYAYDNKITSIIFGYLISVFVALLVVLLEKKTIRRTIKRNINIINF